MATLLPRPPKELDVRAEAAKATRPPTVRAPTLPVPHFRSAAEARAQHAEPAIVVPRAYANAGGLPLSMWLMAALISGIVSYQVAPPAVASLQEIVRSHDAR